MPQAGHSLAHLFWEMEERGMQTIKKEKNKEFYEECGGVKNLNLSGERVRRGKRAAGGPTAFINIVGTGTVRGT